jgi:hypothetical protein
VTLSPDDQILGEVLHRFFLALRRAVS